MALVHTVLGPSRVADNLSYMSEFNTERQLFVFTVHMAKPLDHARRRQVDRRTNRTAATGLLLYYCTYTSYIE